MLTVADIMLWQKDTESYLLSNPKLAEVMADPTRVFNMDETSVEVKCC